MVAPTRGPKRRRLLPRTGSRGQAGEDDRERAPGQSRILAGAQSEWEQAEGRVERVTHAGSATDERPVSEATPASWDEASASRVT